MLLRVYVSVFFVLFCFALNWIGLIWFKYFSAFFAIQHMTFVFMHVNCRVERMNKATILETRRARDGRRISRSNACIEPIILLKTKPHTQRGNEFICLKNRRKLKRIKMKIGKDSHWEQQRLFWIVLNILHQILIFDFPISTHTHTDSTVFFLSSFNFPLMLSFYFSIQRLQFTMANCTL